MENQDPRKSEYFSALPKLIQESIMQSGVEFKNEQEMRKFVSEIEGTGN